MDFDYSKLRGRIREILGTEGKFAAEMGFTKTTISNKLNGSVNFSQNDILKACNILRIPKEEIADYFLVEVVSKC